MSKTIFITGASTGLGKASALLFARNGWKVIATMRNPENGKELLEHTGISVMALDVTDPEAIIKVAAEAGKMGVDVVFNNAGYGMVGPLEGATDEQITQEINTNLLGVLRVTKAFIPGFRDKKRGLFITTTSIGGLVTLPFNSVYHATKWALEGWSESMSFELEKFGIGIKTVSPGGIATDFVSRSLVMTSHPAYDKYVKQVFDVFMAPERRAQNSSAETIAEVVYEAATDGKRQLRYVAGNDAKQMYAQRLQVGDEAFRDGMRAAFFPEKA